MNGDYFLFLGQMSGRRAWPPRRSRADRQQRRDANGGDGAGDSGGSERSANKSASKYDGIAVGGERAQAETDLQQAESAEASLTLTPSQHVMLETRNAGIGRGGFVLGGTPPDEQRRPSFGRGGRMLGEALRGEALLHSPFAAAGSTEPQSPEPQAAAYAPAKPTWRISSL